MELVIFDLDDTLFKTSAKVLVKKNNSVSKKLSNKEYNEYTLDKDEEYDYKEFSDASLFNKTSQPIEQTIGLLKTLLSDLRQKEVIIVTARQDLDNKKLFLDTFKNFGIDIENCYVERSGNLKNMKPSEAKKVVFRKYLSSGKYSKVTLYEDSVSNIQALLSLQTKFPKIEFKAYLVNILGELKEF